MSTLLDLSYDLFNLIFSYIHVDDLQSLKRTNSDYLNLTYSCCNCKSKRLNELSIDIAARYGHLDIVIWLHNNRTEGCSIFAMNKAAENGHLDVVEFLHNNREEGCTTWAMNYAAVNGYLDVVEFLDKNRIEGCVLGAIKKARRNGHFDVVEYLNENRIKGYTTFAMNITVLSIIKYLQENMD